MGPVGLDLGLLEQYTHTDPQIGAVLIAAVNSAAKHRASPAQTLGQALQGLGATQSINLIQGLALKQSAYLTDPCLADHAQQQWALSLRTAESGRTLAGILNLDKARCYYAGLLHRIGDLAVLRCLQEWQLAGGELDTQVQNARQSTATLGCAQ